MGKFEARIRRLAAIPPELVEEVIKHLPLSAILHLLSLEKADARQQSLEPDAVGEPEVPPCIMECLRSSPTWKPIFSSNWQMLVLLYEICALLFDLYHYGDPFPHSKKSTKLRDAIGFESTKILGCTPATWKHLSRMHLDTISREFTGWFATSVTRQLQYTCQTNHARFPQGKVPDNIAAVFNYHASHRWHLGDAEMKLFEDAKSALETVIEGQIRTNKIMSQQLSELADILERYPTYLKRASDYSEVPRPNANHRYDSLKLLSKKVQTNKVLGKRFGSTIFSSNVPILMPLQIGLTLLREVTRLHPPYENFSLAKERTRWLQSLDKESEEAVINLLRHDLNRLSGLKLTELTTSDKADHFSVYNRVQSMREYSCDCECHSEDDMTDYRPAVHNYPSEVLSAIETVRRGLFESYPKTSESKPRILANCCGKFDSLRESNCTMGGAWKFRQPRTIPGRFEVWDGEELEWLRSFAFCMEYFEKAFLEIWESVVKEEMKGWLESICVLQDAPNRHGNPRGVNEKPYKYSSDRLKDWKSPLL